MGESPGRHLDVFVANPVPLGRSRNTVLQSDSGQAWTWIVFNASWLENNLSDMWSRTWPHRTECVNARVSMFQLLSVLSWGRSHWWLMLGSLAAGYGSCGTTWAMHYATKDAMGGATTYRAQPLLSVLASLITVFAPVICG